MNELYFLLLILTAVSVVLLIQVVGVILVITMLTIPAAIANLFTSRLSTMMMIAIALSCTFYFFGIMTSFYLDWPGGASIALLAGLIYVIVLLSRMRLRKA